MFQLYQLHIKQRTSFIKGREFNWGYNQIGLWKLKGKAEMRWLKMSLRTHVQPLSPREFELYSLYSTLSLTHRSQADHRILVTKDHKVQHITFFFFFWKQNFHTCTRKQGNRQAIPSIQRTKVKAQYYQTACLSKTWLIISSLRSSYSIRVRSQHVHWENHQQHKGSKQHLFLGFTVKLGLRRAPVILFRNMHCLL